jgi:esterase/lipase superfamily enzyme
MELLVFGHMGAPVLVFPTSMGRFFEWEDRGMVDALRDHIANGWIQLWCVDSVDSESWYARWKHPADRAHRNGEYERYLLEEVLPLIRHRNPNPFLIATGASFGAYHAANFAFRHPHLAGRLIGLSGLYDIKGITHGYEDAAVYAHNPAHFVANERDPRRIDAMRRMDVVLAVGRDDPNFGNNEYFSGMLWSQGIWNAFRVWDGWAHDWPWWRDMIRHYIGGAA